MARVRLPLSKTRAADLPGVCMICGRAADTHVQRTFVWRPSSLRTGLLVSAAILAPVVLVMLLVGAAFRWETAGMLCLCALPAAAAPILISLVAAFMRSRHTTVECPVCQGHRRYWVRRGFMLTAPLFVVVGTIITLAMLILMHAIPDFVLPYLFLAALLSLVAWGCVATVVQHNSARAIEITEDELILVAVHAVFADLVRYGRRGKFDEVEIDDGWDEYDPYPRKPAADEGARRPR